MTKKKAPGRSEREGLSLIELFTLFPDDATAEKWFEKQRWPNGIACPECGSLRYAVVKNRKPMPYRCKDCRKYFSVRKGMVMQSSKLGYQKWAIAIYLVATSLKGISSMKLHRELKVRQPTAWYLAQRIREGFVAGRGTVGKAVVVGVKNRETKKVSATVVGGTDQENLQGFIRDRVVEGSTVYTDDHSGYDGLQVDFYHKTVKHSVSEYVNDKAHTNGIESFWSLFKRGYYGTYHRMSEKHLQRYVNEFSGRHNIRSLDTIDQMASVAKGMDGKRLRYKDLVG